MKALAIIIVSLLLPGLVEGFTPLPDWQRVEGKAIVYFKANGFEFSVDDSMAHHYEKPTVEISILIPERFTEAGLTNEFDSVGILSQAISTELATHPHSGKQRIILTMTEALIQKSQVNFYFRNAAPDGRLGSKFVLDLSKVLNDWKKSKAKKPAQAR